MYEEGPPSGDTLTGTTMLEIMIILPNVALRTTIKELFSARRRQGLGRALRGAECEPSRGISRFSFTILVLFIIALGGS